VSFRSICSSIAMAKQNKKALLAREVNFKVQVGRFMRSNSKISCMYFYVCTAYSWYLYEVRQPRSVFKSTISHGCSDHNRRDESCNKDLHMRGVMLKTYAGISSLLLSSAS